MNAGNLVNNRPILACLILMWQKISVGVECEDMVSGTDFGNRSVLGKSVSVSPRVEESSARYLRIRIESSAGADEKYYIVLRDKEKRSAQVIRPGNFTLSKSIWSRRINGDQVSIDIIPNFLAARFNIIEYIAMPGESLNTYYSEVNPASKPVTLFEKGSESARRLGDGVGMLMSAFDDRSWCCSGVAVSPNLFLTNWHCGGVSGMKKEFFWNTDINERALIDFSWDGDVQSQEYRVIKVERANQQLDYALLRVEPVEGAGPIHPAPISANESAIGPLRLIHHMACRPKQLSESCSVLNQSATGLEPGSGDIRMHHDCSSNPGSSGAPLFNGNGEVIGLHHEGKTLNPKTCEPVDNVNKAIRISKIVADLSVNVPTIAKEILP